VSTLAAWAVPDNPELELGHHLAGLINPTRRSVNRFIKQDCFTF